MNSNSSIQSKRFALQQQIDISDHWQTNSISSHFLLQQPLQQATRLFQQKKFPEAVELYKQYILKNLDIDVEIDGLGQYHLCQYYYEWFIYRWYMEGIEKKQYKGTSYDALSLCYLELRKNSDQMEKAINWYREMVDTYPTNHAFILGYANVLSNKCFYDQAIDYYERVAEMKPNWARPLECLAFIHEYKRIDKVKVKTVCSKILAIDPKNMVGLFISARNEKEKEMKFQKFKQVAELYPRYVRVLNNIGLDYQNVNSDYENAIIWFEKAVAMTPEYYFVFSNIGECYQKMKKYEQAIPQFFKAMKISDSYIRCNMRLIQIYDQLKYTDEQIDALPKQYGIEMDNYFYRTASAYNKAQKYELALKYYKKAYECLDSLKKIIWELHNDVGVNYDDLNDYENAIKYYLMAIDSNPKFEDPIYNLAIAYKNTGEVKKAQEAYLKVIQVNPRYSEAYNNLAVIKKNQSNYDEAIKYYRLAVKYNSTYTLGLANLGVCFLKVQNYREAFNCFQRAKECLPNDKNNLSQGNKTFLATTLKKFDQEGENWRQNGCITKAQRESLHNLINSFQQKFKGLYQSQNTEKKSKQTILKAQIIQIVKMVKKDEFNLISINQIFSKIRTIFQENEEYFHILPQLFMQYFYKNCFLEKQPVIQIENQLKSIIHRLSSVSLQTIKTETTDTKFQNVEFKMKHFDPPNNCKVNIFKRAKYFKDYAEIYSEIIEVNETAKKAYKSFKTLINYIKKQSYGILFGVGLKIPSDESQQFKVILRIFEKMFKKQMNSELVNSIIGKIQNSLQEKQEKITEHMDVGQVVGNIMTIWTEEITELVKKRKENGIETKCELSDLLRAKIMYQSLDHLKKAVEAVDQMCYLKDYKVIEMDNRLAKKQTQDVVFKIEVQEAVCQLQLAMKQDESQYHFTHCLYEIERSPLGCIFGSYIFMSKGFHYPFVQNCRDIAQTLSESKIEEDIQTVQAAKYIVKCITGSFDINQSRQIDQPSSQPLPAEQPSPKLQTEPINSQQSVLIEKVQAESKKDHNIQDVIKQANQKEQQQSPSVQQAYSENQLQPTNSKSQVELNKESQLSSQINFKEVRSPNKPKIAPNIPSIAKHANYLPPLKVSHPPEIKGLFIFKTLKPHSKLPKLNLPNLVRNMIALTPINKVQQGPHPRFEKQNSKNQKLPQNMSPPFTKKTLQKGSVQQSSKAQNMRKLQ